MSKRSWRTPTSKLDQEEAFRRARLGAIALTLLTVDQTLDVVEAVFRGMKYDEEIRSHLLPLVMMGPGAIALALIVLTVLAWLIRSRVAMTLGGLFILLEWISRLIYIQAALPSVGWWAFYVFLLISIWLGLRAAVRYHQIKKTNVLSDPKTVFE